LSFFFSFIRHVITAEGDMLAALGLRYGSEEGTAKSVEVHKALAINAYRSSVYLARDRGSFPVFDAEREQNNPFIQRLREADPALYEEMLVHGRRNIALLTIAPTGTTSLMTQTTSGIEPVFMISYTRRRKVNPNDPEVEVNFIDEEPPAPPVAPKSPTNVLIIEDSDEEESEPEPPKPRPKSKKSILKLIEDSDEEEPDPKEEFVRLKDSKIVDFLEPEEEVSFLE
jgi:hypothetical protein